MCKFEYVQQLIQHESEGCHIAQNIRESKILKDLEKLKEKVSRLENEISEKDNMIYQHIDKEGVGSESWNLDFLQFGASGKYMITNLASKKFT